MKIEKTIIIAFVAVVAFAVILPIVNKSSNSTGWQEDLKDLDSIHTMQQLHYLGAFDTNKIEISEYLKFKP